MGKKSRFFLELNEMPNKNGRFATGFVRHFSILMHGRRLWPNAVLLNKFSQALSQIYRQTILGYFHHGKRLSCILKKGSLSNGVDDLKTSLQKWSGVFLFPSVSSVFFQIGTVRINTACVSAGVDSCMNSCR